MKHFAYIIQCKDGTYYAGYTNDLEKRIRVHNAGEGAKYTRGRGPVELVYVEELSTKSEAMQREHALKQLPRKSKEQLIQEHPWKQEEADLD